jgi:MFS family permease
VIADAMAERSVAARLTPLMLIVLIAFLAIGIALPVLPLHVRVLGFGPFMIGMVTGSQFAASLLSRVWSGRTSDNEGPKRAVLIGLAGATLAGLLYFLSLNFAEQPNLSVIILLAGM